MNTTEISGAIDDLGDTVREYKQVASERVDSLQSRIEELEALQVVGGNFVPTRRKTPAHQVVYTQDGQKCYLLPRDTEFAEVCDQPVNDCPISYERWVGALVLGEACHDKEALDVLREQKSLVTTTTGIPVPNTTLPIWIDNLRAQSVVFRAGAQTLTMPTKSVTAGAVTADPSVGWHTEAASISAGDPTMAARTLTAQTLVGRTQISFEAGQDVADIGEQLGRVYTRAMAAELDRVALAGTGSGEPTGIASTAGRSTIAAVGTPTDWSDIVSGVGTLLGNNLAEDDVTGIVISPTVWTVYAGLKTGITSDNTPLRKPPAIESIPIFVTSNAPGVGSSPENQTIIVGDYRDLVVGIRTEAFIRLLDGTTNFASNLLLEVVGVMRADIMVRRPASFCTLEGVTTS
jgi:HK97 family phage major capsid protein